MAIERRLMTAEELLRLPDDGMRHELIDGELRTTPPAGGPHGHAGAWAHFHLATTSRLIAVDGGEVLPGFRMHLRALIRPGRR